MATVTERIKEVRQPRGGYLSQTKFEKINCIDNLELFEENLTPSLIGQVVDYLTRFMVNNQNDSLDEKRKNINKAFEISIKGYEVRKKIISKSELMRDFKNGIEINQLLDQIKGLDDGSIVAACKAANYDVWYRNPYNALVLNYDISPDANTIQNIRIMVNRGIEFFAKYGPIILDGFSFEKDGYSSVVTAGDGDYLTIDTIWDFKVLQNEIDSKHTLQLLMYWVMGKHSKNHIFDNINRIGIFNPRLNRIYLYDMRNISKEVIKEIEDKVICY